jgi:two-component system phosphate regulon response regulator PhoB
MAARPSTIVARIVVADVDDDERIALRDLLAADKHYVSVCANEEDVLLVAQRELPHLTILADDLASQPTIRALKRASRGAGRIVVLTSRGGEDDRVAVFENGADDCVVRPFSTRELVLRVRAIIGRDAGDYVERGSVRLDRAARMVWIDHEPVPLVAIEFELLDRLIQRAGFVVMRRELIETIWGIDGTRDSSTPLERHVERLCEKLGPAGDSIEFVFGVGFRFRLPA